jgi:hypothetical protein
MLDQLTNKEILLLYLSTLDSRKALNKGLKATQIFFRYNQDMGDVYGDNTEEDEKLAKMQELIVSTAKKKIDIMTSIIGKLKPMADLIIDANPELYTEVENIIFDKNADDELKSLMK